MTMDQTPRPSPTSSYWQDESADLPLHDHGRDAPLPGDVVDVVVIGSGISGAVAAYMLQRNGTVQPRQSDAPAQAPSIVMLEARKACSGATGRNGGHCRPDVFLGFNRYAAIVGKQQAHKVLENEWDTFTLVEQLAKEEDLDCDWWRGQTLAVYRDESLARTAQETFNDYAEYAGSLKPGVRFVNDEKEAQKISRVGDACATAVWPAASLHPIRFVHGILQRCIEHGNFALFTHTPVGRLRKGPQDGLWNVETSRGTIRARKVLLATNGYSNPLLPALQNFLTPHRGQCSAIIPPASFSGKMALTSTASIVKGVGDYEYLTQQPSVGGPNAPRRISNRPGTGAFILGGGHPYAPRQEQIGTVDDSVILESVADHLTRYPERTFVDWSPGSGQLKSMWTGIQGYTRDSLPLVGAHYEPEQEGLYLCLGHHGHGMARAATCARGIAREMLRDDQNQSVAGDETEEWERATLLPHCYRWTRERAMRVDVDCRGEF